MDATKGLPGIDNLFRKHSRLSKKLSSVELRALSSYIEQRVLEEHDTLLFQLRFLKSAHEHGEQEYQHTLTGMQQDLDKRKWIASEFKREFGSLAKILKQRDQRYKLHRETLIEDLKKARLALTKVEVMQEKLTLQINQKDSIISEIEKKANQLRINHRMKYQALHEKHAKEMETTRSEILKLKHTIEKKDKEASELKADLYENKLSKGKVVTFKGVNICDECCCTLRSDLDNCRAELVRKCKHIAALGFQIEQGKQKIREQAKVLDLLSPVLKEKLSSARVSQKYCSKPYSSSSSNNRK